nr:MAG: putative RNA-dependent RNA polymerase [Mitoviridae sp.]
MTTLFGNALMLCRELPWRCVFEYTGSLHRFLVRISRVVTGHVNRESAVVALMVSKRVLRMYRHMGALSTSLYLKQCGVSLMRYYSSSEGGVHLMAGASVSLSRAGIPTIIPVHHRQLLAVRDERADQLVKLYLSWFTICRIIKLAKPISASTFRSIVDPVPDIGLVKEVMQEVKETSKMLLNRYLPQLQTKALELGFRFVPTWKATPNDDRQFTDANRGSVTPTIFTSVKYEIAAFAQQLRLIHSFEGVFSPGILYQRGYLMYPFDYSYNTKRCNEALSFYESWPGLVFDQLAGAFDKSKITLKQGRLCQSLEGAGKRRLFVLGNYLKQRLLYPVHEWTMNVLRSLPTDGTFHQDRPIHRLVKSDLSFVASFDLSSATDRWPVPVIHDLVACIFGPTSASCIVNGCLALNCCEQQLTKKASNIVFVAGQPLGYYGSWALFALTHHYVVWLAAHKAYPTRTRPFHRYALLGDDVVIADKAVADEYRKYLQLLQVKVSDAKSIVSGRGAFEFAKQFWVGMRNLSPVSAKAVLKSYSVTGVTQLGRKYQLSEKTLLRLSGFGYRTLANLDSRRLSNRARRVLALGDKQLRGSSGLPLEWWIGRGLPISPYTNGTIIQMIRDQLKLQQLQLVPVDRFWGDGEVWTTENQLYRNWMVGWLKYLKWFVLAQSSTEVTIEDLLNPPIVSFTWKRRNDELVKYRHAWSILYKVYDWAEGKDPGHGSNRALIANWPALPYSWFWHASAILIVT